MDCILKQKKCTFQWAAGSSAEATEETPSGSKDKDSRECPLSKEAAPLETPTEPPNEDAHSPAARRRASADAPASTPDRKKRRLTRPRKL